MKRSSRARVLSALLTLAMVFSMLPTAWAAEEVSISGLTKNVTITAGDSQNMELQLTGAEATRWGVSGNANGVTATIDAQGKLEIKVDSDAENNATATLKITAEYTVKESLELDSDGESQETTKSVDDTCIVTVKNDTPAKKPVTNIELSATSQSLNLTDKKTADITVTVEPGDATNKSVVWSVSGDAVTLGGSNSDSTRTVTAQKGGTATITVKAEDGSNVSNTIEITVTDDTPVPVTGVSLNKNSLSLTVGGKDTLIATVAPTNASNQKVNWSSSNDKIASVDSNGNVTAVAQGSATITATTEDGKKTATCSVTVTASTVAVTGVTLDKSSATVNVNGTTQLTATVAPSNASNKNVIWKSSNTNIATVDSNGKVTGKAVGEATITVTTADGGKTATCKVTVSKGSVTTITYSVAVDKTLTLERSDFYNVCTGVYGNGLEYVKFDKNSSKGTLYYNYTKGDGGAKISTSERYYYSSSSSKSISKITFVPDGNSGDTAVFTYVGYDSQGKSYEGTLQIKLTAPSGDISYETGKNETITFTDSDFNSICKKITGSSLDYVTFGSVSSSKGALYLDYGGKDEDKLSTSTKCYYNDSPYLSNVTFVPAKDYTGTFTISYSGRSNARDSFSGSVKITVRKSSSVLSYTVVEGKTLTLDDSDFNDFCKDETGYNMDYVKITPPSSSKGTFYYRYGESRYAEKISSSDKYYRTSSPKLDDVTFVPEDDYNGTVSVSFTGLSTDGDSFSGTMKIRVGDTDEGDITYTAAAGTAVTFNDDDFNDYCKDITDYSLDYVRFTLPSDSKGTLYYQYDKSGEKKVSSSTSYYRSSSPRLYDVTFVPAKEYTGNVEISFTGRSTDGDSFSGTVVIAYSAPKEASVIRYSTTSAPVTFSTADFINACSARGSGSLTSVKFELPSTAAGKLYYGYTNPTKYGGLVSPAISFPASTGSGSISSVTFVPKASYNGTVSVNYTGTDSKNNTFTGRVDITVTPSTQSKRFTDMGNHGWAAASVDFLYDGGITTGTSATTYGPALNITRGDFILMLYRAFNLSANTTDGFKDVPSDSYYAQAIAVAKALGIAQGSDDGRFNPTAPLTREDAMVFLYRTLNRTGRTIASASASYLNRFSDGSSTSSYAQDSVAALAQAGIIQGDTNGRLNPKGSLTRAEMAVILHRVVTL